MKYESVEEMIGNTPLFRLKNIEKEFYLSSKIYAKIESRNPAGSAKDRVALSMISSAENECLLKPGSTIIEPTSGNTGIGLCALCAAKGYHMVVVMPDSMSKERILLMKAYGAEVVLTDGKLGMKGAIDKAEEMHKKIEGSIIAGQFENPANPRAHYTTTGPEIYNDCPEINALIATIGTGGTISGIGKYLKEKKPNVCVIGVEPEASPLLSKGVAGPHKIQGIGANFIPKTLDREVIDEIYTVTNEDAYKFGKIIGIKEGILAGISSGAALKAAIQYAEKNHNQTIVVVFPDGGDHYLSTEGYYS